MSPEEAVEEEQLAAQAVERGNGKEGEINGVMDGWWRVDGILRGSRNTF